MQPAQEADVNPFEEEVDQQCPIQKEFPAMKAAVMQALEWRDMQTWEEALQRAVDFHTILKPKLDSGDRAIQEFNRTKVI